MMKDLIAYYPFDGNALDMSGNGHHGVGTDISEERDRFGILGGAVEFNGETSKIVVPDSPALRLDQGDFTILLWVKETNRREAQVISKHLVTKSGIDRGFGLRLNGGGPDSTGMTWHLAEEINARVGSNHIEFKQNWRFFGIVYTALTKELKFFLYDSFQEDTFIIEQPLSSDGAPLVFGQNQFEYTYGGLLDDLRIFGRALSEKECQDILEYDLKRNIQSEYEVVYGNFSWSEAESDALSKEGHLASITSQIEWLEVRDQLGDSLDDLLWIGGFKNDLGEWGWVTGEDFTFSAWAGDAPNNIGGNENFIQIVPKERNSRGYLGGWNDHSDSSNMIFGETISGYLLEKPKPTGTASAVVEIVNGFVVGARVTNAGYGYITSPEIQIISSSGSGAKARAVVSNGQVVSIDIISTGSGYLGDPQITIAAPPKPNSTAIAEAEIVNGFLVGLNLTKGGHGYEKAPNVTVLGGNGTGASVDAFVADGKVVRLEVVSAGNGYTSSPVIRIDPPEFAPRLSVRVKQVEVNLQLVVGKRYSVEHSKNFVDWQQAGPLFMAEQEFVSFTFDSDEYGRYYRVVEQP